MQNRVTIEADFISALYS